MDYPTLRITQHFLGDNRYRCELTLDGNGRLTAITSDFNYNVDAELWSEICWYFESYPQYPSKQFTARTVGAHHRLKTEGETLFKTLFLANEDTQMLWERAQRQLTKLRIEISIIHQMETTVGLESITGLPWELLRDPTGEGPLASVVHAFVRLPHSAIAPPSLCPTAGKEAKLRILFVIAYPDDLDNFAFRSVARRLIQGLSANAKHRFEWEVLYPPTFIALSERLHRAKEEGRAFHVVHYDGQALWINPTNIPYQSFLGWLKSKLIALFARVVTTMLGGHYGYLLFDPPKRGSTSRPASGAMLGKLLNETDTPWLVLNSCHAVQENSPIDSKYIQIPPDPTQQLHTLAAVAVDVMNAGVNGVVTLDQMIPLASSAQFIADLYTALGAGCDLGEAVNRGRRRLYRHPQREIGIAALELADDWSVPMVHEAVPLRLFPITRRTGPILRRDDVVLPTRADHIIPARSASGFLGRDETLALLMRAFNRRNVVLLHGPIGAGKTQVAAELVRWGLLTGFFVDRVVIWSDFSKDRSLTRLLDDLRHACEPLMQPLEFSWLQSEKDQQYTTILQFLQQTPILWIWDHVEVMDSIIPPWEDRHKIFLFLRLAARTKCKFLIISHQEEWSWLGRLPERVWLPPLPTQECLALIRALTKGADQHLKDPIIWSSLLDFVDGNPAALTLIVESILREKLVPLDEINDFVDHLESMSTSDDDTHEPRDKNIIIADGYDYPLSTILIYQFITAKFTNLQRSQLSLLHLFQGFVDVDVLSWMSEADDSESLPVSLRGVSRDDWLDLLNRAVQADLLVEISDSYYQISPLRSILFSRFFMIADPKFQSAAIKSYLETMGDLGNYYQSEYEAGRYEHFDSLVLAEANLLHAWRFARWQEWWDIVLNVTRGLLTLYLHTQRGHDWVTLVNRLTQNFVHPQTNGTLPDREEYWGIVTDYRIELAIKTEDWPLAELLQNLRIDWDRRRTSGLLDRPVELLDDEARFSIQELAQSVDRLGQLFQKQSKSACIQPYQVAFELNERIGSHRVAAMVAIHTYRACQELLKSSEQANYWSQKAVDSAAAEDASFQAKVRQLLAN